MKKVYIIGIGGIGTSAIARYYKNKGYEVFGSDKKNSELIEKLKSEGINIIIGENKEIAKKQIDIVIYSEAIEKTQIELKQAINSGIKTLSYPEAIGEITKGKKLISIAGTHGKSTTTSLISIILKNSDISFTSIVGTLLKEFNGKNFYTSPLLEENTQEEYFVVEACEYKESFLNYKPTLAIITNIEADHLDYYKNEKNYIKAFEKYILNVVENGFVILNGEDKNCEKLLSVRQDINYIKVYDDYFLWGENKFNYPEIKLQVPGNHILYDAKVAYIVAYMLEIEDNKITKSLENYCGVWRRMEIIGKTENGNTLMSDYGHHPTEVKLTLEALKQGNKNKKMLTIFQPHQYSRTLELLDDFKNCFSDTDKLIIPDIYESRDSEEDKKKINSKKLIELINHKDKLDGEGLDNTLKLILDYDKQNPNSSIIVLLGAGNIDDLRYKIKTS